MTCPSYRGWRVERPGGALVSRSEAASVAAVSRFVGVTRTVGRSVSPVGVNGLDRGCAAGGGTSGRLLEEGALAAGKGTVTAFERVSLLDAGTASVGGVAVERSAVGRTRAVSRGAGAGAGDVVGFGVGAGVDTAGAWRVGGAGGAMETARGSGFVAGRAAGAVGCFGAAMVGVRSLRTGGGAGAGAGAGCGRVTAGAAVARPAGGAGCGVAVTGFGVADVVSACRGSRVAGGGVRVGTGAGGAAGAGAATGLGSCWVGVGPTRRLAVGMLRSRAATVVSSR